MQKLRRKKEKHTGGLNCECVREKVNEINLGVRERERMEKRYRYEGERAIESGRQREKESERKTIEKFRLNIGFEGEAESRTLHASLIQNMKITNIHKTKTIKTKR